MFPVDEKIGNSQQRNRNQEKTVNLNSRTKKGNIFNESSLDELCSRTQITGQEAREPEIIQCEEQREDDRRKETEP